MQEYVSLSDILISTCT